MSGIFTTPLDERMDADIDRIIEQLQRAKLARTYLRKSAEVGKIAERCQEYEGYWTDRLYDLMD